MGYQLLGALHQVWAQLPLTFWPHHSCLFHHRTAHSQEELAHHGLSAARGSSSSVGTGRACE